MVFGDTTLVYENVTQSAEHSKIKFAIPDKFQSAGRSFLPLFNYLLKFVRRPYCYVSKVTGDVSNKYFC